MNPKPGGKSFSYVYVSIDYQTITHSSPSDIMVHVMVILKTGTSVLYNLD